MLDHFPHLIKLEMDIQVLPSDNNGHITCFIAKHAATLEYLSFATPRGLFWPDVTSEQILEAISQIFSIGLPFNFPRLRTLVLDIGEYASSHGVSLAACIRPFVNTVTTFILKEQGLSMEELDIVSNVFALNPGALTSAWLGLESLDPQAVDLLAERFPGLTDLTLTTSNITRGSDFPPGSYSEVCLLLTWHPVPKDCFRRMRFTMQWRDARTSSGYCIMSR
jgi:hypothetical protein